MKTGKLLEKAGKQAVKHRRLLLAAAAILAPGLYAKGAAQVAKAKRKIRAERAHDPR